MCVESGLQSSVTCVDSCIMSFVALPCSEYGRQERNGDDGAITA